MSVAVYMNLCPVCVADALAEIERLTGLIRDFADRLEKGE